MLFEQEYKRELAVAYAKQWALKRNPKYYDFEKIGGDCTNFVSQCIFAANGVMNDKPVTGWYYYNAANRSPAWTGVTFFYEFLVANKGVGPFAEEVNEEKVQPGDIVQLGGDKGYYHSPIVVEVRQGRIFVAAHSFDVYGKPLDQYLYQKVRYLHIQGVRQWRS